MDSDVVSLPLEELQRLAAALPMRERCDFWRRMLERAAQAKSGGVQSMAWDGCLRSLILEQATGLQTLLQGPAQPSGSDEEGDQPLSPDGHVPLDRFGMGVALLRSCETWIGTLSDASRRQALQQVLADQLVQVVGRLHRWLVIEEAEGGTRGEWFWKGWELLQWRQAIAEPLPEWWLPVREQLVRLGALAWKERSLTTDPSSKEGQQAITRALTLLQALATLHDPLPIWIPQEQRALAERGLAPILRSESLSDELLQMALKCLRLIDSPEKASGIAASGDSEQEASAEEPLQQLHEGLQRLGLERLRPVAALHQPAVIEPRLQPPSRAQERTGPPVTLTTISSRLATLPAVLESLRHQTYRPAQAHLHLSHEPHLLDQGVNADDPVLQEITADGWVQLHWVPNLGPYRKIVPFLQACGYSQDAVFGESESAASDLFITVDDDTLYPPRFIEYLMRHYERHRCIVAHRGRRICLQDVWGSGPFRPYAEWHDGVREPRLANLPTGQSGVLYRRSWFPEDLELEAALALAPSHDDLWLRWLTGQQGVRAVILQPNAAFRTDELAFPAVSPEPIAQQRTLWHAYNGPAGGNDVAVMALQAYWQARGFDLAALLAEEREREADFY